MAEIINLRQKRKAQARASRAAEAADNRVKFGLTKAAKKEASVKIAQDQRRLDQLKLAKKKETE